MAAPAWPSLTEGQWNLAAQNVLTGKIDRLKSQYEYWTTYVLTGASAPIAAVLAKSPKIFKESTEEFISAQAAIDVYVWIEDADSDTDSVVTNAIQVSI